MIDFEVRSQVFWFFGAGFGFFFFGSRERGIGVLSGVEELLGGRWFFGLRSCFFFFLVLLNLDFIFYIYFSVLTRTNVSPVESLPAAPTPTSSPSCISFVQKR